METEPFDIIARARRAVIDAGFLPDFPPEVADEAARGISDALAERAGVKDLRHLLWSSIDNLSSRDLDQVEYLEDLGNGKLRICLGIADVEAHVPPGGKVDARAATNTTSIYTGPVTFHMLPDILSTEATSLLEKTDRLAVVVDMQVEQGELGEVQVYRALVRNQAKLDYDSVGRWFAGVDPVPAKVRSVPGLEAQVRLQEEAARMLRQVRARAGALSFDKVEVEVVKSDSRQVELQLSRHNPARDLIESFMIAANMGIAKFLREHGVIFIERVVRVPRRWNRIREIAERHQVNLPVEPDVRALSAFILKQKERDPEHYAELSLSIVKSLGPGEYALEVPGGPPEKHFSLAADDYTHSTAPNRRYADIIIQRQIKAVLDGSKSPYALDELREIARHCTEREDAAHKVERLMRKVIAANKLRGRVGEEFKGVITGASNKGTYVRLLGWPAEGMVVRHTQGLDVGDRVKVRLLNADPEAGFIDFEAAR